MTVLDEGREHYCDNKLEQTDRPVSMDPVIEQLTNLSRDEAAQVGVNVLHEGHVEQRQARLHSCQDVGVTSQRVVSPL